MRSTLSKWIDDGDDGVEEPQGHRSNQEVTDEKQEVSNTEAGKEIIENFDLISESRIDEALGKVWLSQLSGKGAFMTQSTCAR